MRCPFCNTTDDTVIDSRPLDDDAVIRRRRECIACHKRYTTYERVETTPLMVIKRSGGREPFDRAKVRAGIVSACRKRPISADTIEAMVNEIEHSLHECGNEVQSSLIGDKIIARLKAVDDVAYVRFASVYKQFDNVDTFLDEIKQLRNE